MIKTTYIKICDVCKKEVENVPGSLSLEYDEEDAAAAGHFDPVVFTYDDICIDCCRKLHKAITKVFEEIKTNE